MAPAYQQSHSAVFMLPEKCPFSCRLNSPWVMSRLRSWTGREFYRRRPAAAKVLLLLLLSVRGTTQGSMAR